MSFTCGHRACHGFATDDPVAMAAHRDGHRPAPSGPDARLQRRVRWSVTVLGLLAATGFATLVAVIAIALAVSHKGLD